MRASEWPLEGRCSEDVTETSLRIRGPVITLEPKKLILTRRASEGSEALPSLARRVSMCKDAKLSCRGNRPLISPNSLQLSQVFASSCWLNLDPVEVAVDFLIEFVQGAAHRCVVGELVGQQFSQRGPEQTSVAS